MFADTLHYCLLQLTNLTVNATSSIRQKLTAIRLMVLLVLDLVKAAQGGVCHIVGKSCCTYIPDNDADGGAIAKAIDSLKKLSAMEMADQQGKGTDWWSWLSGRRWKDWLISFLASVIGVCTDYFLHLL